MPRYRLSSYGRRAFSVAGRAIWNWLPDSMRDPAISRDSFRRSLKTFLFSAYLCTQRIRAFWTMRSTNLLTYISKYVHQILQFLKPQKCRFPAQIALRLKEVCYKVSLCENCQQRSCRVFIGLTYRAKMIGVGCSPST